MRTINISNLNTTHQRDRSYDRGHSVEPKRSYTRQNTQETNAINKSRNEMIVQDFGYNPTTPFETDSPAKKTPTNAGLLSPSELSASKNYFIPSTVYQRKSSTSQDRNSRSDLSMSHRIGSRKPLRSSSRGASPDFNQNLHSPHFEASRVLFLEYLNIIE